eukprot:gene9778-9935_t
MRRPSSSVQVANGTAGCQVTRDLLALMANKGPRGLRDQPALQALQVGGAESVPCLFHVVASGDVQLEALSAMWSHVAARPGAGGVQDAVCNCSTSYSVNDTITIAPQTANELNRTFNIQRNLSTLCPTGNTTLLTGGCDLNCTNAGDYLRIFLTKQLVVPGTNITGSNAFVECAARWGGQQDNRNVDECKLMAIASCC